MAMTGRRRELAAEGLGEVLLFIRGLSYRVERIRWNLMEGLALLFAIFPALACGRSSLAPRLFVALELVEGTVARVGPARLVFREFPCRFSVRLLCKRLFAFRGVESLR